jgi:hypothetical protein
MLRLPRWHSPSDRFSIIVPLIALVLFVLEQVNGRFWLNDLRVYYDAALAMRSGSTVYGEAFGLSSGFYKYAPVVALLFTPYTLLPFGVAATLHFVLMVAAFVAAVRMADQLLRDHLLPGLAPAFTPLLITFLVVVVHLHRELHLGNVNVLLLCLLLFTLHQLVRGKALLAGALFGLALLVKPHFLVLAPLLLLHGQWRTLLAAAATVALGLVLPSLFTGWSANLLLHHEWLDQMARHNAALIYLGGSAYENVNTVYSLVHRAVLGRLGAPGTNTEAFVILAFIALAVGVLVLRDLRRSSSAPQRHRALVFHFLLLLALVPSLTLTDSEHFILALPLVLYMAMQLRAGAPRWLLAASILAFALYGGNWEDALGPFSDRLIHYGALGMGNLLVIGLSVALYLRSDISTAQVSNPA